MGAYPQKWGEKWLIRMNLSSCKIHMQQDFTRPNQNHKIGKKHSKVLNQTRFITRRHFLESFVKISDLTKEVHFVPSSSFYPFITLPWLKTEKKSPGWVAQLVTALFPYTKVVGSISAQGIYKKQLMNA